MSTPRVRWTCIAWAPYSRRSEMFARALGGSLHCIHYLRFQTPLYAPFKYPLQAVRTLQILWRERPQAVHVQNPPFICSLVVDLYCRLSRACLVLDHHSAAFARIWRWALPLQKLLARRAVTNIVTNVHWAEIVQGWGAHALVMGDPFLPLPEGEPYPLKPGFNIAFVSTYAPDEPLEAVIAAARQLPDVNFYVTGNPKRQPATFFEGLPPNVICTGFLPDDRYVGLLHAVDAVMSLTTRNYTLQLGGCEAVAVGKPLITSNWPFLQEFFAQSTIYVDNTPEGICAGVIAMQRDYCRLATGMLAFRDGARRAWDAQFAQLCARVEQAVWRKGRH